MSFIGSIIHRVTDKYYSSFLTKWLNLQGSVICIGAGFLWIVLTISRLKIRWSLKHKLNNKHNNEQKIKESYDKNNKIEKSETLSNTVYVVLCCNGNYKTNHCTSVWESQLSSEYNGKICFFFIIESTKDKAYDHVVNFLRCADGYGNFLKSHPDYKLDLNSGAKNSILKVSFTENIKINKEGNESTIFAERECYVYLSGVSFHNAQKIHNMIFGIRLIENLFYDKKTDPYITFFDDDIRMHRSTVPSLIKALETKDTAVASGYSVEIPSNRNRPKNPPFADYLITAYRSINLIGFIMKKVTFAWGGCLMMRLSELYSKTDEGNKYNILDSYIDGGYSDDMILSNIINSRKSGNKTVIAPYECMFLNELPDGHTFSHSYINYIRRQYFVLDTYISKTDRNRNKTAAMELFIGGLLIGLPVINLFICISLYSLSSIFYIFENFRLLLNLNPNLQLVKSKKITFYNFLGRCERFIEVMKMNLYKKVSWKPKLRYEQYHSFARSLFHGCFKHSLKYRKFISFVQSNQFTLATVGIFIMCGIFTVICHNLAVLSLVDLVNKLSPEKPKAKPNLSPAKMLFGLAIHCILMPFLMFSVLVKDTINWSGTLYTKKNGKIIKVVRQNKNISREESLRHVMSSSNKLMKGIDLDTEKLDIIDISDKLKDVNDETIPILATENQ